MHHKKEVAFVDSSNKYDVCANYPPYPLPTRSVPGPYQVRVNKAQIRSKYGLDMGFVNVSRFMLTTTSK